MGGCYIHVYTSTPPLYFQLPFFCSTPYVISRFLSSFIPFPLSLFPRKLSSPIFLYFPHPQFPFSLSFFSLFFSHPLLSFLFPLTHSSFVSFPLSCLPLFLPLSLRFFLPPLPSTSPTLYYLSLPSNISCLSLSFLSPTSLLLPSPS